MCALELQIDIRGFIKSKIKGNSHTYESALSELIHNSIEAKSKNIYILHNQYNNPIIVDDGVGMDKINIEKLKKFYDSSERLPGTIGTYNIGLKEALLKFGGNWIILSKKSNTEDIVYCEFNCNNLDNFSNGGDFQGCIDSGFANRKRENIFTNILHELGLINIDKETSLFKFSGTVIFQQENKYNFTETQADDINYEENKNTYELLYNNLKLKLSKYTCNFIYGFYNINNNNIIIDDKLLQTIKKFDWLCWNNNQNSLDFNIIVYKTAKNTLFAIEYNKIVYKYNKKECEFNILKTFNKIASINIKCNILNNNQHNIQELYYKDLNYKNSINGIIINRNGLDLYDYPNKYDNRYVKDICNRKFARIYVSFIGNDDLDTLFNILPNKSLFLQNNLNTKLKNILELIKHNIYEYLDLNLQNTISLSKSFQYILQNKSLEIIRNNFQIIEQNFIKLIYKIFINNQIKCIKFIKPYILCKKIKNYYDTLIFNNTKNLFNIFQTNYFDYYNELKYINNITQIQLKFKYNKKLNIFKKLGLCIVISKLFNINTYLHNTFNHIKSNNITDKLITQNLENNYRKINYKFTSINQNINTIKLINQLLLFKYKYLCFQYENSIFI